MKKVVLLYWGKGGNVEKAANTIYQQFDPEIIDIFPLDNFNVENLDQYKLVILGGSTVGAENWQDATNDNMWNNFLRKIENKDLSKLTFAAFGLGNQVLYPNHFVDGLGFFNEEISKTNAKVIGKWPTEGYSFTDSEGEENGMFYGLALDEDTEPELTAERAKKWTDELKKEMGF